MLIRIKDLQLRPLDFSESFPAGAIDLGPDSRQVAALTVEGRATLVEENRGHKQILDDIRIAGKLATEIEAQCARCLEPVRYEVKRDFDLLYRPQGADRGPEERPVSKGEAEIGYYEDDGLQMKDLLREQVLLAVPYRLLCREGCKGLCPVCGRNLNTGDCDCEVSQGDARWNALGELRDRLKH